MIEGVLLIFSLRSKETELTHLNTAIASAIESKYNLRGVEVFSDEHKAQMLLQYFRNIILLTLLIVFFTSAGFLLAYNLIVGRYLKKVFAANVSGYADLAAGLIPEKDIPEDDIGKMMRTRNTMIQKIIEAEKRKKEMTQLDVFREVGVAYNHEVNNVLAIVYGYLEILKQGPPDKQIIAKIENAFGRLEEVGRQFRERTRYESTEYVGTTKMAKFE